MLLNAITNNFNQMIIITKYVQHILKWIFQVDHNNQNDYLISDHINQNYKIVSDPIKGLTLNPPLNPKYHPSMITLTKC